MSTLTELEGKALIVLTKGWAIAHTYIIVGALLLAVSAGAYFWAWSRGYDAAERKYEAKEAKAEQLKADQAAQIKAGAAAENPETAAKLAGIAQSINALRAKAAEPAKLIAIYPPGCMIPQANVDAFNAAVEAANAARR